MANVPVLIVGGGPVGLALAGDLAWRGIASQLVERTDGAIYQPKMDLIGVRTMEYCRRWGIVERVENSGYNRDWGQDNVYVTSLTGYELGRECFPASKDTPYPPQSPQRRERAPQDLFDPVLHAWVAESPLVTLRYGTELLEFQQTDERVLATVVDHESGRAEQIEVSYLAGCDGASSRIGRALGVTFTGGGVLTNTTNIVFRSSELPGLHDKGEAYRFIVVGPEGTWATLVAINGRDRWRFSIVRSPENITREQIEAAIVRAVGVAFPFEILSVTNWTRTESVAESYGRGRVYLAGDAVHTMSPTGGFGMNTGIGDAVDLAWKLEAMLLGWGGASLLDAYTVERRPVAVRNSTESSRNLGRMLSPPAQPELCDDTPAGAQLRERFGREFSAAMRHEWYTIGIHLGFRYDDSPVCWSDGTPAPPMAVATYEQTTRPGARAPHVRLADDRSTLDLFGRGFVLVQTRADADPAPLVRAAAERGVPLQIAALDEPAVRSAYERALVLVRPDGHVAWRGDAVPEDAGLLIDCVRGAAPYAWRRTTATAGAARSSSRGGTR